MGQTIILTDNEVYVNSLRVLYFILSTAGLLFTSTLLIVLGKRIKKSRHSDVILTIIAVSVDCIASGGLLFRAIFSKFPYNIFQTHYNWCGYDVLVNNFTLTYSGYVLSILSIQRMLLIVFNIKFSIYIWLTFVVILYLVPWTQMLYHVIEHNIALSVIEDFCIVLNLPDSQIFYFSILVITMTTCILTVISYIGIIIFLCRQCLKQLSLNLDKSIVYKECRAVIFKSLFFLIPYMLIYSGRMYCWFYELITGNKRTRTMEYTSIVLLSTCVIVNCLTILYMHKEIKNDFVKLVLNIKKLFY
jgi:hypothetical protein